MEYALIVIYLLLIILHGSSLLQQCIILLAYSEASVLNKVHVSLSFAVVFPVFVGDIMVLISCISPGINLHNVAPIFDYGGVFVYQTLFYHHFQYRSSMLYKGIAHRFHDFVVKSIIIKAMVTPAVSIFGLILSQIWGYPVESYVTLFQVILSVANFGFNSMLMRKFLSLNLIQANRRSLVTVSVIPKPSNRYLTTESAKAPPESQEDLATSSSTKEHSVKSNAADDMYTRVKTDIYRNMKRALFTGIFYFVIAVTLLGVFNDNTPRSGFFTSIAFRITLAPAVIATNSPIWKAYKEYKRTKNQTGGGNVNGAEELVE